MASLTLTDSQQCTLTVAPADKRGNPTGSLPAGATVAFLVDNPNVLKVTTNPDGISAVAASVGPLGNAVVTVNATMPDGTTATGSLQVTVIAGAATQIAVVPGVPIEQP